MPWREQLVCRSDAAAHEDRRREVRARGEHDGAGFDAPSVGGDDTVGASVADEHAIDERVADDLEVLAVARRVDVCERRVPALPVDDVRGERARADGLPGIVEIGEQRKPDRLSGLEERAVERAGWDVFAGAARSSRLARSRYGSRVAYDQSGPHSS